MWTLLRVCVWQNISAHTIIIPYYVDLDKKIQKLWITKWENFKNVINKAIEACKNSNINISDDFADIGKIVKAGATTKKIEDYKLSIYACYLIAQNGDSRKKVIALAQTYFAIQTRKQEISEKEQTKLIIELEKILEK